MKSHLARSAACAILVATASTSTFAQSNVQQLCFTDSVPTMTTGWNSTLTYPRFDPNLGTLLEVEFQLNSQVNGTAQFESLDMQPATVSTDFSAIITVFRPGGGTPILSDAPTQSQVNMVSAFDGTIDFAGTSGMMLPNLAANNTLTAVSPPPASDLVLFTGPPGNPGTVTLDVSAVGASIAAGAGNLVAQFMQTASASLRVCYRFELGQSKCNGDGGNQMGCTNCLCNNNAPVGTVGGCLNSVGTSARIVASGVPSQSNDTLQIKVFSAAPNRMGTLFSSSAGMPTNPLSPCFGLDSGVANNFMDGLRCLGGSVRRQGTRTSNVNGNYGETDAPWGPPAGPPGGLIARAGWMPGQTICYQVYYRDDPMLVCNTAINTTNALRITILP